MRPERQRDGETDGERWRGKKIEGHFITAAAQADCLNGIREAKTLFPSVFVFVALHFRLRLHVRLRHITNGISLCGVNIYARRIPRHFASGCIACLRSI